MRSHGYVFVLVTAIALAACSGAGDDGPACNTSGGLPLANGVWPKYRHDNANTGDVNNGRSSDNLINLSGNTGALLWQYATDDTGAGGLLASPTLSEDGTTLYIGSSNGRLYALGTATGQLDLTFYGNFVVQSAPINSSAAIDDGGTIYVQTNGSTLLELTPSGLTSRALATGGVGESSVALATDGTVFAGTLASASGGFLTAICTNGIARWSLSLDPITASVALGPDGLLGNGRVADCSVGDTTAPHGLLFVASSSTFHPFLRAIDRCTAQIKWTFSASAPVQAAPVLQVDTATSTVVAVYLWDTSGRLYNLDPSTGKVAADFIVFEAAGPTANEAAPALGDDGTLYVGASDGNLYAIDADTGTVRWTFETDGPILSSPALAKDGTNTTIVFGSNDGHVYRVIDNGSSGIEAWRYPPEGTAALEPIGISSPAIDESGTVYIGTSAGLVLAIGAEG
jgi:outer membrane protein assembly factor BamB